MTILTPIYVQEEINKCYLNYGHFSAETFCLLLDKNAAGTVLLLKNAYQDASRLSRKMYRISKMYRLSRIATR